MSLPLKLAFWATVAGQIILLLAFIAIKENTLRTGTSVLLQTVPIDPRSILQGDFAILDYEIADLGGRSVRQGETVGFIGANGAGKSTTIKSIMGFIFPQSGSLTVFGEPVGSVAARRRIGYLPEVTLLR